MSVYYPSGCEDQLPDHYCDECEEIEQGRLRSFALIKKDFNFTDPSNPNEWNVGIDNGDIIVLPATRGSYDGGAEVMGPGFGDVLERLTGMNHSIQLFDPNYADNAPFYNSIRFSRTWKGAYRTSSKVHLIESTIQLIPKNPVQDDPNTDVLWDVAIRWASKYSPVPYDAPPGVFDRCVVNI